MWFDSPTARVVRVRIKRIVISLAQFVGFAPNRKMNNSNDLQGNISHNSEVISYTSVPANIVTRIFTGKFVK